MNIHLNKQRIKLSLEKIVCDCKAIEVVGPRTVEEMSRAESKMLEGFKDRYASRFAPYLLNAHHRQLDSALHLQGRCVYFYANLGKQIVACTRLSARPYEWEALLPQVALYAQDKADCVEFGRLMVEPSVRGLKAGMILMGTASLWAIDHGYQGVVALCRQPTRKVFQRYGLSQHWRGSVRIHERENGEYFLLHGSWDDIAHGKVIDRILCPTP